MSEIVSSSPAPAFPRLLQRPVLPAPAELPKPPGFIRFVLGLARDPLRLWTREHFDKPFVRRRGPLGDMVTLSNPAAIRHVFLDNAANYRKDRIQLNILEPLFGASVLTAEGETWRRHRRIMAPLFTPRAVAAFAPAMREVAEAETEGWLDRAEGRTIAVHEAMAHLTLAVLSRTVFAGGGPAPAAVTRAAGRYLEAAGSVDPLDVLGAPAFVPRVTQIRARPALQELLSLVDDMVAQRRAKPPSGNDVDLLAALLAARDPETGEGLGPDEIRNNVLTILAAGHETTANALTWTLMLLALHPPVREACEAEADTPLAEGEDPLETRPLLRAVVEEAMRLYPPASVITREAIAADEAAGCAIPAGALVAVSPWVLHRHRLLWDQPTEFHPQRFLPGPRDAIPRFAYMPFGAGPRICIGAGFALLEAVVALAVILRRVRLDMPAGARPPMPRQRITLRPDGGLVMVLRRRTR